MREIGRNFRSAFYDFNDCFCQSQHTLFIDSGFMLLLFKFNIMMILMRSNIGFKLSARLAFPGNFQPLKVHFGRARSRNLHSIAYSEHVKWLVMRKIFVAPLNYTRNELSLRAEPKFSCEFPLESTFGTKSITHSVNCLAFSPRRDA